MFCTRNPVGVQWDEGRWYDGSPAIKTPMDNYISLDRLTQSRVWDAMEQIARGDKEVKPRGDGFMFYRDSGMPEGEIDKDRFQPCCEGGPVEGHAYTCMYVIGVGFG